MSTKPLLPTKSQPTTTEDFNPVFPLPVSVSGFLLAAVSIICFYCPLVCFGDLSWEDAFAAVLMIMLVYLALCLGFPYEPG